MIRLIIPGIVRCGGNVAPSGEKIQAYWFLYVKLKDIDRLEDLGRGVKIRMKCTFNKQDKRLINKILWIRRGRSIKNTVIKFLVPYNAGNLTT